MAFETILYDVKDGIATVTLNRPERLNAWTRQMEADVREAMHQAGGDDAVRAIILMVAADSCSSKRARAPIWTC